MVFALDKLTGTNFTQSQAVLHRALEIYWRRTGGAHRNPDDAERLVDAALVAYLAYENTVCWEVNCAHVAEYLDKTYGDYLAHETRAVQILQKIAQPLTPARHARNMRLVKEFLDEHRSKYETYKAMYTHQAQGAVPPAGTTEPHESGTGVMS